MNLTIEDNGPFIDVSLSVTVVGRVRRSVLEKDMEDSLHILAVDIEEGMEEAAIQATEDMTDRLRKRLLGKGKKRALNS